MAYRRRYSRRALPARRKSVWVRGYIDTSTDQTFGLSDLLKPPAATATSHGEPRVATTVPPYVAGCTVARVRMDGLYQFSWAAGTTNFRKLGFTYGLTTDPDSGIMVVDSTTTMDPDADWFQYGYCTVPIQQTFLTPIATSTNLLMPFHLDAKVKRKLSEPSDTVYFVWEAGQGHTVNGLLIVYSLLLLLP